MLLLQASIGALNDVVDAPRDAGLKPRKPIPAGLVTRRQAVAVAVGCAGGGVLLAVPSGAAVVVLAVVILGIGYLYDLRLKGTPWSWLPFAAGIPLLPVFAWVGTTGDLPPAFAVVVPAGFLAGAALAVGNGLVDVERDRAAGVTSVAARLGRARARVVMTLLYGTVLVVAAAGSVMAGGPGVAVAAVLPPAILLAAGVHLAGGASPDRRERGWRLQVLGVAVLATGWLASAVMR